MPHASRDEVTLYYEDEGQGQPVLLLHGHTFDRRMWTLISAALVERGWRVLTPDLRGHGHSLRTDSGYLPANHARDMEAVLDAAGVSRAVVVGFSLGGAVALEMAVARPGRVEGLVLASPVMPDRPFEAEFMDNLRQVARTARGEGVTAAMLGPWMESPLFEASWEREGVRERVEAMVRDFPGAEYLATERDRPEREWALPDRLGEITCPTRVLVGEREMAGFRAFADEAAAGIPTAELKVVAGAGHLIPLENPDEVLAAIIATRPEP